MFWTKVFTIISCFLWDKFPIPRIRDSRRGPGCSGVRYVGQRCFIFQRLFGSQQLRGNQPCTEFKLWATICFFQAIYASVLPGELMRGYMTQFPTFPSWLGKHSSTGKHDRIVQDLALHMSLR